MEGREIEEGEQKGRGKGEGEKEGEFHLFTGKFIYKMVYMLCKKPEEDVWTSADNAK